jgi:Lhr-like helicase
MIELLLERYKEGLSFNIMHNKIGSIRETTLKRAISRAIKEKKIRRVKYGKIAIYKINYNPIVITKDDIRKAINYYYGKRCKEEHANCIICEAHGWLDEVKE